MNEPKSARYHRLKRRAGAVSAAASAVSLAVLLWTGPDLPVWLYALVLVGLNELAIFPAAFYRSFVLEHRFELSSESAPTWARDHLKALGIRLVFAAAAAEVLYALIRAFPEGWWLAAALSATAISILISWLAPVLLLPLFYTFTPLGRSALSDRLVRLCGEAGVRVLGAYEWALGAKTRRANAALAGSGATRRILLSDTLLADYSDDEVEVILAHELGHHVHGDIPKALALDFVLFAAMFYTGSITLQAWVEPLGLRSASDVRGLPVLLLVGGALTVAAVPLLNAVSRMNERRADLFAFSLTGRCDAFITAMRRLASQNVVEESPSRVTVWLFHSHPPIEERIAAARDFAAAAIRREGMQSGA